MNDATYIVPAENLTAMSAKLDALIRRAAKLGLENSIGYSVSAVRIIRRCVTEVDLDGTFLSYEELSEVHDVRVWGEAPSYAGWTFVAVRDHAEGGAPLIRAIGHQEIPLRFRAENADCEHCKFNRARKETFVLVHEDGTWIQVGRSCIKDFLGHNSPENIVSRAELIAELCGTGDWCGEGSGNAWHPSAERYLAFVACAIRHFGWTSKAKARDENRSTSMIAWDWLLEARAAAKKGEKSRFPLPSAEDKVRAQGATAWALALGTDGATLGDYLYNVNVAAKREILTWKAIGIIASIIPAWDRAMAFKREVGISQHVGAVGDKFVLTIKPATKKRAEVRTDTRLRLYVQSVSEHEGTYGLSYKNTMIDEAGNVFVWWTGSALQTSACYLVAGTIKAHGEWKGRKETVLTRCGVERVEFEGEAGAEESTPATEEKAA